MPCFPINGHIANLLAVYLQNMLSVHTYALHFLPNAHKPLRQTTPSPAIPGTLIVPERIPFC